MAKLKRILGLDIGSTKIACVIAESDNNGKLNIIGQGISNPEGFRNGIVINLERAVVSVAQAIEDAEKIANVRAKNCHIFVGISGSHIKHMPSVGTAPVKNPGKGITEKDVNECLRQAQAIRLPPDEQIIHLIPNQFIVDGQKGIRNPIGMFGVRLELDALLIIGTLSAVENLHRVLDHLELKANSLVLQPQAISLTVTEPEDKDLGIALVDIGGNTNLSIFKDGVLRFYKALPLGGDNLTKDISIGLRTPYKKAEEIKKLYGRAMISCIDHDEPIVIEDMSGRVNRPISQRLLTSIIEPRIEEILQHCDNAIRETGLAEGLSGGIILTGGTSMLKGIDILAEQIFRLPVKIANCRINTDETTGIAESTYYTAIGLIRYGLMQNGTRNQSIITTVNGMDIKTTSSENIFEQFAAMIKQLFM
jgi:cell division protein FtsA